MSMQELRNQILTLAKKYSEKYHAQSKDFSVGDKLPYAGRIYDQEEIVNLIDSALEFWLTSGRYVKEFERSLASYLKVKYCLSVNSGSSANLLAFMALTSPLLGERQIKRGDEVITVAAGFPTTISPIINYGAIPVFVDVKIPQYNIDVDQLEMAVSPKTKAIMIAHTLGNPFNLKFVKEFCDKHSLWLIEDNCDALGSKYYFNDKEYFTGTVGDIGTSSFYPAHHITTGEGGAVYTNNPLLNKIMQSMRDWGRACTCPSGYDNTCGHRFDGRYGELPKGYDHKYVYSHFGYNLKITEMQAAIGCAQLKKLPGFIKARRKNWKFLREKLQYAEQKFILPEPCENSEPSWFGFLLTCKEEVNREQIVHELENAGIQTRMLFAGNIINHPCFDTIRNNNKAYRVIGNLTNTEIIMNNTFWIGVYPGMTEKKLDYICERLRSV